MNVRRLVPGLTICAVIGLFGWIIQQVEQRMFGRPYIEGLVVAILVGVIVAALWNIPQTFRPGIDFSARQLLETAVCLIGVAIDTKLLRSAGLALFGGVVGIVLISLVVTYAIGRAAGLRHTLALLVAAGNSICGNSAIAAVAPVIGAEPEDVASAISFTAVLGVVVVLLLPLLVHPLALSDARYGVVAGLTVYAVPQVLAATLPVSAAAGAMATLVKLMRVLLLGPLVLGLGLMTHRSSERKRASLIPWFIIGFLMFAAARSFGLLSTSAIDGIRTVATVLTIVAMAALGLGVDVAALRKSSGRVIVVVCLSLLVLATLSVGLSRVLTLQ